VPDHVHDDGAGSGSTITDASNVTPTETPTSTPTTSPGCLDFETLQIQKPGPLSEGRRKFPYVRPPPKCRKFRLPALEDLIERLKKVIRDPDLFRLFENSYPNTLDTMVKWRGYATKKDEMTGEETATDEELTYVITGDIDAMWLRDSASQVYSYLPLLEASQEPDSLASLWRGLINAHSRYITISPYCHSFQPPPESGIPPTHNAAYSQNHPNPPYDPKLVFDCKWELDSLASFLQVSAAYYRRTGDLDFFGKYSWVEAVEAAVDASAAMRLGTYDEEGHVLPSAWTFTGWTDRGSETLTNDGLGNPVKQNGMVRSAFRPSDDACIFQLLTPSNMMWAAYLEQASDIMEGLADRALNQKAANLTAEMRKLAKGIRRGITLDAVVKHRDFGDIFAYEVDGYGGANLMDDANVPSLLAMPLWNYTTSTTVSGSAGQQMMTSSSVNHVNDTDIMQHDYARVVYQNTRRFVLSSANPYFAKGPVLSAVGGPHLGPGKGWPMAAIVAALTAYEDIAGFESPTERDKAVAEQLFAVLNSTAGKGVIHETVNAWNEDDWTRSWFGWANGLFGELILRIAEDEEKRGLLGKEEGLLGRLWQD
jgi:meiotically up-regulated gene 157 (Mug157) protein